MAIKFKNPPINELVIGIYFDPIYELRAEHVGLFWSTIKTEFPQIAQNPPIRAVHLPSGQEVFPMARYWLTSKDEATIIQIQKNAFLFNWRHANKEYEDYESVKADADRWYARFAEFLEVELNVPTININHCELTYINLIENPNYWTGGSDTSAVIPSFSHLDVGLQPVQPSEFNHVNTYYPVDDTSVSVTLQTRQNVKTKRAVLYFEISAHSKEFASKADADAWFTRAHETLGAIFNRVTSPDIQERYWSRQ